MHCEYMKIEDCQAFQGEMPLTEQRAIYRMDQYSCQSYHNSYDLNCSIRGNLGPGPLPPTATYVDQANQTRASDNESEDSRPYEFLDLDMVQSSDNNNTIVCYMDGLAYDIDLNADFSLRQFTKLSFADDDRLHDTNRHIQNTAITTSHYPMSPDHRIHTVKPEENTGPELRPDLHLDLHPGQAGYESSSPSSPPYKNEDYLPCRFMTERSLPAPVYNRSARGSTDSDESVPIKAPKRRTRKAATNRRKRKTQKSLQLWQFLRMILADDRYNPHFIIWVSEEEGIFKFVQSKKVAQIWGQRKERPKMPYEHLSRAMRHYYRRGILRRIESRRLTYQFLPNATGWREGFTDREREVTKGEL